MSGINKVILVGHIGQEPELRHLPDEVTVLSFLLATTEFITKHGLKEEHTEWHHVVMWRSLAETGAKLLHKGRLVYVEGRCKTRSFEDKDGIRRYTTEIAADHFTLLGRNSDFEEPVNSSPSSPPSPAG